MNPDNLFLSLRGRDSTAREEGSIGVPILCRLLPLSNLFFLFPLESKTTNTKIKAFKQSALTCRLKLECQEAREYDPVGGNWSLISPSSFRKAYFNVKFYACAREVEGFSLCQSPSKKFLFKVDF